MSDFSRLFDLEPELIYLNHAAVAPWPKVSVEAVCRFAEENGQRGSLGYPTWMEIETALRGRLATLINASPAEIALVKNTSEALSFVAAGLDWHHGDNIISSNEEFPSNRIVWDALRDQGVSLREADLGGPEGAEEALLRLVDERTRMIAVSSIQFGSGRRLDLAKVGRFCRQHDILFCVDAIQSVGAVTIDVEAAHIDFLAADGHKCLLGPEGLGVFYCRAALRETLRLSQYGWHMVEHSGDFSRRDWVPANSGRRFEAGSPNMLAIHALHATAGLLLEIGMSEVETRVLANSQQLMGGIRELPAFELITPDVAGCYGGIVTFRPTDSDPEPLHRHLINKGVFCAPRGGGIRFSPHFHTPTSQLERALEILAAWQSR